MTTIHQGRLPNIERGQDISLQEKKKQNKKEIKTIISSFSPFEPIEHRLLLFLNRDYSEWSKVKGVKT